MKSEFIQKVSKDLFNEKYCLYGEKTLKEVYTGVSEEISSVEPTEKEIWKQRFYDIMISREFIPGGRIVANARVHSKMKNYQNCYVIPIGDSMEEIYKALAEDALIGKMGGGVGFNISSLRPKGAPISKGGESSGPISFLEVFDSSSKAIHTGGGRRGAHIVILNCDHPDIEQFVTYKQGDTKKRLTQFNISVGITDKFMKAVEKDVGWDLVFGGKVYKTLRARDLYDLIMENMFTHNEPGIFFLDEVQRNNTGADLFKIEAVNPCGEQPLPEYGCCCLGSLNLSTFVRNPFSEDSFFDIERMGEVIKYSVRFLDNVLSASDYPLPQIQEKVLSERRIGLGITGFADAQAMLGIIYGSELSKGFAHLIGKTLRDKSYEASIWLSMEKGSFPLFNEKMLNTGFLKTLPDDFKKAIKNHGLRNIALNTIAPTGTTSISIGQNCSSGVEPIFALEYDRTIKSLDGGEKKERVFDYAWLEYKNIKKIKKEEEAPSFFKTSFDLSPYEAIEIQGILQKYIDAAISKTANLPKGFSYEDFKGLFEFSWKNKLKGFTSFNPEGSMKGILSSGGSVEEVMTSYIPRKRPKEVPCDIYEMFVNKKRLVALVGILDDRPYEVFLTDDPDDIISLRGARQGFIKKISSGKYQLIIYGKKSQYTLDITSEYFDSEWLALGRMISLFLRTNISLPMIVKQLNSTPQFGTFSKGMARVLKKYITDLDTGEVCPECGKDLKRIDGCIACECGWSKCD